MISPPGKMRTRAHVLADLSINHVERQALLCGFSVDRVQHDYGYDLTMSIYRDDTGEFEPGLVFIQVKSTDRLPQHADGRTIPWLVSRCDLKLWLAETYPVILVVYDGQKDRAYWIHVQRYVSGSRTPELFAGGETITVHMPMANRFNSRAIRSIAREKNVLQARLQGEGSAHV
jgi:hypothetical protein